MNIGKSLTFVFEDARWLTKMALGALISFVPVLNFALVGYAVEIARRVIRQEGEVLPEWSDLGKKFTDGLSLWVVGLVYSLPLLLVGCLLLLPALPQMLQGEQSSDVLDALSGVGIVLAICGGLFIFLYMLLVTFLWPALVAQFTQEGSIASCFRLGEILGMVRSKLSPLVTIWLTLLAIVILFGVAGTLVGLIPCIGQLVLWVASLALSYYINSVYGHLVGQLILLEA